MATELPMPQIEVEDVDGPDCLDGLDPPSDDHLRTLKALTEKLRLETRRPSYQEWRAQVEAHSARRPTVPGKKTQDLGQGDGSSSNNQSPTEGRQGGSVLSGDVSGDTSPPSGNLKGFGNIDEALVWLRKELVREAQIISASPPSLPVPTPSLHSCTRHLTQTDGSPLSEMGSAEGFFLLEWCFPCHHLLYGVQAL